MGLNFLRSSEKKTLSPEAKKLLEGYMAGAKKEIGFVSKENAEIKATEYARDFYESGKAEGLSKSDVKKMEKQVAKELRQYGIKERVNYATNLRAAAEHPLQSVLKEAGIGVVAVTAITAASVSGQHDMALGLFGVGAAVATARATAYFIGAPTNEDQKRKIDEYTDLKHAQLALKQLKREFSATERAEFKKEVAQLFAAGYGQPSGGLIQAAKLKNQGR